MLCSYAYPSASSAQWHEYRSGQGLRSLCENSKLPRFCSARLQAGTLDSSRCPPEGGRYMNQNRVRTRTLRPIESALYINCWEWESPSTCSLRFAAERSCARKASVLSHVKSRLFHR